MPRITASRPGVSGMLGGRVARSSAFPVCADESATCTRDVLRLAREGAVQVINIKLMKSGVLDGLQMWSAARAAGLGFMIGGMVESILAMSFSAHFAAGLGGFGFVDLDTPMFVASHPFGGGFRQQGERISVAHVELGHGVTLVEE